MNISKQAEIDHFLITGEYDSTFATWAGDTFAVGASRGDTALRNALISEVLFRADQVDVPASWKNTDQKINARAKFSPMVHGLFSQDEHSTILDMLEHSVVFLTPATIIPVLKNMPWLKTAWDLANIYLSSLNAELLTDDVPAIVGISEETTCYVSMEYFHNDNKFNDYVTHEAAHIFHNCKRKTIGLPETRRHEWLLDIDYAKRETFAYACEAYSRILELGGTRAIRSQLLSELAEGPMPSDDKVQAPEYVDILKEAVAARNGWKRIHNRCVSQTGLKF